MKTTSRGFTLIELLVVIAIVAVLAVTVILTLNPAQLLKQARDSNRTQDLATIKSAISLYLADYSSPDIGSSSNCYVHASTSISAAGCGGRFSGGTVVTTSVATASKIDGTGWIKVDFTDISAGSPISSLPQDPVNNGTYYYAFKPDATAFTFEVNALIESTKFGSTGSSNVVTTDGGNSTSTELYEVGTDPGLDL